MSISPRSGHLNAAWEVAVVSAFAVVFVALVSVVIFQVRRTRRRQRDLEAAGNGRPSRRKASATNTKIQQCDLEKGANVMDLAEHDFETVSEEGDIPESKRKKKPRTKSSRPRTKAKHNSRSNGRKSSSPRSSTSLHKASAQPSPSPEYYFEHPSQKPPKYYWDPQ
ncbi:hypothetical protein BJ912DRAFT_954001 [Pholiota molesta]|nr:hypothetical protein BJ912DRAFT_954001 [Pholiota molesta]